jgi:uncharacterized protein
MKLLDETRTAQHSLATYCRTGEQVQIPGVKQNRLHHYRRLVRNVINNTLEQAYPITLDILTQKEWDNLVDDFLVSHNAQTPQVWKLPNEFYDFVRDNAYHKKLKRPYLNDLLHFEWIEIEIHTMPDEEISAYTESGDMLQDQLVFTPEFRIIQLEYPVHLMTAHESVKNKGNFYLLVFREKNTGNVNFLNLSVLLVYLIEQMHHEKKTLNEILPDLQNLFGITNKEEAKNKIKQFLNLLYQQKFLMGYKR